MFTVDFEILITMLLPPLLRQTIFFAWMRALCAPVVAMYNLFVINRTADLYNIAHDSRVFSMQAVFNDSFDAVDRRIYISDGFNKPRIYLYTRDEDQSVFLNPSIPLYNPADYADTGIDFIVWVPNAISMTATDLIQLAALVNQYKLASKRYAIYRV